MMAVNSGPGRDTNDPYMTPPQKAGDPPNPQWNMQKIQAYETWGVYTGLPQTVVVVQDYGVDFRHEDLGATQANRGNLWDYGKIHSTNNNDSFTFSKRGRDDLNNKVHVPLPLPTDWNDRTQPKARQYFGNIGAGIIGAATNNGIGVAGVNWKTQIYSSEVVIDDKTSHTAIAQRSNRVIQWLRAGLTNPDPQEIRAVSFGYSSVTDYGDIFNYYSAVPEPYSTTDVPLGDAGHYDFISLGQGIASMPDRDATWGILVTVPTGDWSKTWPTKYYREGSWGRGRGVAGGYSPGSPDNIIAVAATDINDRPWVGNARNPIDIYAPGVNIVSLAEQGDGYSFEDGTRQAQAHVAGAIAIIYDAAKQHERTLTYHQVREAIIEGGDDIGLGKPRLNVAGSLRYLGLDKRPVPNLTSITISGGSAAEGDRGASAATFRLALAKAVTIPTTVVVGVEDGSARRADGDYVLPTGGTVAVTIPAGQTQAILTVNVIGDPRVEGDETFTARIVKVPSFIASGYNATASWTIRNDDSVPSVSILAASAREGSAGRPGAARVMVQLDKPSEQPVSVQYSLVDGTAVAGIDFRGQAVRTITIPARSTSAPIDVRFLGNDMAEPDRALSVRIDSVVNAAIPVNLTARSASVTILDDDRPTVTVQPATASALQTAATIVFVVRLSKPVEQQVTVGFTARDGSGTNAARAGVDYTALTGTVVFAPGETLKRIEVTVLPRRSGQRYPKEFRIDLTTVSANASLKSGSGGQSVVGRIA